MPSRPFPARTTDTTLTSNNHCGHCRKHPETPGLSQYKRFIIEISRYSYLSKRRTLLDLDSIEAGRDFDEVIRDAIDSSAVLVALIGRQWATLTDENGHPRLDNPNDYVRFEIQAALERDVRVIPVLVDGARPLRQQQLPSELHRLARLNAVELSYGRYQYDADQLFDLIERVLATASGTGTARQSRRRNDPGDTARLITDAERIAQAITDGSQKYESFANIAKALAAIDPDRAEGIARSIADDGWRVDALAVIAKVVAATDRDRAARLIADAERIVQSIPEEDFWYDSARADIAMAVAATDPDRAERIAQSIWDDYEKATVIANVLAASDPDRAEHIAQSMARNVSSDTTLAGFAKVLAVTDPVPPGNRIRLVA